jgi:photosystem II stability/assembly factor-like uncharacterized protein
MPMRWSQGAWVPLCLALMQAGCTFYTACPADNGNNGPSQNAGTGNQGGSGNAGGDGSGGNSMPSGPPKPLLEGEWLNVTSNLAELQSECGNLSYGASKPDEDLIILGVATQGLWGSRNGGESWEKLGSDSDPEQITNRASSMLFDPESPDTFWESGVYNAGGVYKTTDGGGSFTSLNTHHNDFVTVDFTDPKRKTLLISGHEQVHELSMSTDGGETWTPIGDNLPDDAAVCAFPYIIDSETFLLGCGTYSGGQAGILRSTDAGESWERVADKGGGAAPLRASDGTIYWASEVKGGIVKSDDDGETWSSVLGADIVFVGLHSFPLELPDGRITALSENCVIVSDDGAKTWKCVSTELPYAPGGFLYSPAQRAFFIFRSTCEVGNVPADGVMRFDFDYDAD